MSGTFGAMGGMFSMVLSLLGGLIMVMGVFRLFVRRGGSSAGALIPIVGGGGVGLFAAVFPQMIKKIGNDPAAPADATASPTTKGSHAATPAPSASPTPTNAADAPQAAPFALPKVENLETLWLIPLALLVLFVAYFMVKHLVKDRAKSRQRKAAEAAAAARLDQKWQTVVERHQKLIKKFLAAETDWDMLFKYPALTDVNVPTTRDMVRAMQAAADADSHRPETLDENTDLSALPYPRAVREFGLAWDAALRHAKKVGQDGIPKEERQKINKIRSLLALAENSAASENERQLAYKRAHDLVKELRAFTLPAKAVAALEERQRVALTV